MNSYVKPLKTQPHWPSTKIIKDNFIAEKDRAPKAPKRITVLFTSQAVKMQSETTLGVLLTDTPVLLVDVNEVDEPEKKVISGITWGGLIELCID